MPRIVDTLIVFRILKLLTTKWENFNAYKLGIIDKNGNRIKTKDVETSEEKNSFDLLHRLVFNLKRIINKLPFGKTAFASYAVALLLLKEHTNLKEDQMEELCEKFYHHLKNEDLLITEMLTEAMEVGNIEVNHTYRLRRQLKEQNDTIYPEKTQVSILQEHSKVFGITCYIGFIGEDRVLVTADDVY